MKAELARISHQHRRERSEVLSWQGVASDSSVGVLVNTLRGGIAPHDEATAGLTSSQQMAGEKCGLGMTRGLIDAGLLRGVLAVAFAFTLMTPAPGQEIRKWTDASGSFSIEAKYVSLVDGKLTLQKADGSLLEVPVDRLSVADKAFATIEQAKADANPFKPKAANPFTPAGIAPTAPPTAGMTLPPAGGATRELKANAGSAKLIQLAGVGEWKVDPDPAPAVNTSMKAIPVPSKSDFFEKVGGLCLSGDRRYAVVGYHLNKHNERTISSLAFCDLQEGRALGSGTVDGVLFAPIAVQDSGTKVLVRSTESGFGKGDRLEVWALTSGGIHREAKWAPYDDAKGGDRDVKWAAYLDQNRLATVNAKGRLVVWNADTAQGIYQLTIQGIPAMSPGRKHIAFLADKQVGILDAASGNIVALRPCPTMHGGRLAFTPSGTRLVAASMNNIFVWDVATGELERESRVEGVTFHRQLVCPSEEHALGDNHRLYDFVNQVALWDYTGPAAAAMAGETCWLAVIGGANQPAALVPAKLPHSAVEQKLTSALADPNFFVFKAGTTVKIDTSKIPDSSQRTKIQDDLTKKLAERQCQTGSDGTISLVAEMENQGKTELKYRTFGSLGTDKYKITKYVTKLSFVYQGKTVWSTSGNNLPSHFVHLGKDETMKQHVKKRDKPDYTLFSRVSLPKLLAREQPLGRSAVTVSGIR